MGVCEVPEVSNMASTASFQIFLARMYKTYYGPLYTRTAIDPARSMQFFKQSV